MHAASRTRLKPKDIRAELPALLHLAIPLIAGELGWMAMSVVDTVMVGRLPNSAVSMAAAALSQVLFNTLTFGIGGILLGLDTVISQAFGAKELHQANRWLLHGLVLAVALAAALSAILMLTPAMLLHLPVDQTVLTLAAPALRGLTYGALPLLLYFALRRYLQAANHGRSIAFALISANIINASGDWLLMYGHRFHLAGLTLAIPAFGVLGSAWSTSFSRLYLMAVLLIALILADRRHHYGLRKVVSQTTSRRIEFQHLRKLFLLGAPAGAQIFVEIAIFALVTTLIATFGPVPLAGHEVALQCASTTFMVPFAISSATAVRVGHAIGRVRAGFGTLNEVAAAGWTGILAGATVMLVASVIFLATPPALPTSSRQIPSLSRRQFHCCWSPLAFNSSTASRSPLPALSAARATPPHPSGRSLSVSGPWACRSAHYSASTTSSEPLVSGGACYSPSAAPPSSCCTSGDARPRPSLSKPLSVFPAAPLKLPQRWPSHARSAPQALRSQRSLHPPGHRASPAHRARQT